MHEGHPESENIAEKYPNFQKMMDEALEPGSDELETRRIQEFMKAFPDRIAVVEKLLDPNTTEKEILETIDEINLSEQPPAEGLYNKIHPNLDDRKISFKYFKNGRFTVSYSLNQK